MEIIHFERAFCDRIVRHVDSMQALLPPPCVRMIFEVFGRKWTEIMLRDARKVILVNKNLKLALINLDRMVLDLIFENLVSDNELRIYKDFTLLKTMIS